ncbi:hypothetical protein [Candidatus Accumulibacter vicinus]|uniref:CRISPR type I-E protein CasA/Cse1 n=1 Tax=Candidatus Accumulibacter vicinus TaxID=2954382 RepID=A0A084Y3X6_9PROT|nr:hypothetical protein [Candidatus Accumulibacter vicinus]KFB69420.1 MAG: CRISPR type I-E protein CasA/Cse1 [Candidatus Accumulibacter vicinus]
MALRYNLLDEPLIRTRLVAGGQPRSFSLPGLFVALGEDTLRDFPALRPHQRHPWHAFLVQLAAIALHRAGREILFDDEASWRQALLDLTPDDPDGAAWCLIAPHDRPAFMQAPVPGGNVIDWINDRPTPDSLDDVLVTSRNHDLKPARISLAQMDDWIFALTSLQTQGPCPGGAGKIYGITRMNGGASSRPGLGLVVPGWFGNRWKRDVLVAIKSRQKIVEDYGFMSSGGIGLLWTIPWAGSESESIPFPSLDPYFIEVCRRVRLVDNGAQIFAIRATSKMRIVKSQADKLHGNTGDLWTPIDIKNINEPKSLGVSESGFPYNKMADLAFGPDYIRPPAQEIQPSDPKSGLSLLAMAIGAGQSKTAGYHERRIPITKTVRLLLQGNIDQLAAISRKRIQVIAMVARMLKISLETLFDGGRKREKNWKFPKGVEQKASKYVRVFDQGEDARFFDDLIIEIENPDQDDIFPKWQSQLLNRADKILNEAFDTGPQSGEQRYRARSTALEKFRNLVRDKYPDFANYYLQ